MIVAVYRALWWCNQHKRVATSAVLESGKSIPAFPVPSFICEDACLYFKAQEFPSISLTVLQSQKGSVCVCVCAYLCVSEGGSKNSVQQRKARKKMSEFAHFCLLQIPGKSKTRKHRFLCMYISKKCDIGERSFQALASWKPAEVTMLQKRRGFVVIGTLSNTKQNKRIYTLECAAVINLQEQW